MLEEISLIILYGPINDLTDNENFKQIPERVGDTAFEDIQGKISEVEGGQKDQKQ